MALCMWPCLINANGALAGLVACVCVCMIVVCFSVRVCVCVLALADGEISTAYTYAHCDGGRRRVKRGTGWLVGAVRGVPQRHI